MVDCESPIQASVSASPRPYAGLQRGNVMEPAKFRQLLKLFARVL